MVTGVAGAAFTAAAGGERAVIANSDFRGASASRRLCSASCRTLKEYHLLPGHGGHSPVSINASVGINTHPPVLVIMGTVRLGIPSKLVEMGFDTGGEMLDSGKSVGAGANRTRS
jgi:hypothetical protein